MHILTWNLWGIPFAAPKMLSRPLRCADRLGNAAQDSQDLTIICVQEAWGWGAGVLWPFLKLAQLIEGCPPVWWLSYAVYTIGALGVLFPVPPRWDPKPHLAARVAAASGRALGQDLFVVGDQGESQDYCHAVLDSGLMLLLSMQPSQTGFSRYAAKSGDDAFANKGYLWAYIQEKGILVVTTHLQASGPVDVKVRQLHEMRRFLDQFLAAHEGTAVIAAGDWNLNASEIVDVAEEILGLKCITTPDSSASLDHVLSNVPYSGGSDTEDHNARGVWAGDHLSDHPLVQIKC